MIFRYTEKPSVNSILVEKMLWAARVKVSQEKAGPPIFPVRQYTKSIISPAPPETLRQRVDISSRELLGSRIHILAPKDFPEAGAPVVLFLHGGSYVVNATRMHWKFLAGLVERSGCRVVAPDYPLAPARNFADAYVLLVRLYNELRAGADRPNVVIMGDSAGGGLALGLAMMLRDEKLPPPEAIVMLSPWLDVTMSNPHIEETDAADPFLNRAALAKAGASWAGGANPRKPLISPIYGTLGGLPPMHLFIGTKDILVADCRRFQWLCLAAGARLAYYEFENMIHDWMLLDFKESKMAAARISAIVAELKDAAGSGYSARSTAFCQ